MGDDTKMGVVDEADLGLWGIIGGGQEVANAFFFKTKKSNEHFQLYIYHIYVQPTPT
jgi:hypothetical protein